MTPPGTITILSALIFVLLAGCRPESPDKISWPADTIALVGKVPLYQKDLDHALTTGGNRPAPQTLQELAGEEALAQLALAEGMADDPSVRAAMRRMLASRLREKHAQAATIDAAAIAAAVADQEAKAPLLPRQYHLAFLRQRFATAGSETAAVAALEQARAKFAALPSDPLRSGFGTLAAEVSDDTDTRYQGGTAGWITPGKSHLLLPDSVTSALTSLQQPGVLPDIIRSTDAAWLGMVTDIKTPAARRLAPAQIEAQLRAGNAAEQAATLLAKARAANPITILQPQYQTSAATPPLLPPTPPG